MMAMTLKEEVKKTQKKDRPYCTHCKMQGHTIEKCYKLHGYPPGVKGKTKGQVNCAGVDDQVKNIEASPTYSLTSEQYQQLLSIFSSQISATTSKSVDVNSTSLDTGAVICFTDSTN